MAVSRAVAVVVAAAADSSRYGGEDGADIEARTEGVGPHPLFNGVSWVEVVLSVRPTAESARNHLVIRGPGFSADFTNATYSVSGWQYLVRSNGPSGGK